MVGLVPGLRALVALEAPSEGVVALQLLQVRHKAVPGYKLSWQVKILLSFLKEPSYLYRNQLLSSATHHKCCSPPAKTGGKEMQFL